MLQKITPTMPFEESKQPQSGRLRQPTYAMREEKSKDPMQATRRVLFAPFTIRLRTNLYTGHSFIKYFYILS